MKGKENVPIVKIKVSKEFCQKKMCFAKNVVGKSIRNKIRIA